MKISVNEGKSTFSTKYKYCKYQVKPFKLANTLLSFQSLIKKIFDKKLDILHIVYLNNIFAYIDKKSSIDSVQ